MRTGNFWNHSRKVSWCSYQSRICIAAALPAERVSSEIGITLFEAFI